MKTMHKILLFTSLSISLLFIGACSGKAKNRAAFEATSSLIASNPNIVAFGHVNANGILTKTGYKSIPKVNVLLESILSKWKGGIAIDKPVYFAVEAPFDSNGNPKTVYAMMDLNSQDSLKSVLAEMGYSMEKDGEISYFQENDLTFGMRNNLLVFISRGGAYDGKALIKEAFEATEGDLAEGKTNQILTQQGDLVAGVSVERLFKTSNTDLSKIDDAKKKELEDLTADAYTQHVLRFEKGKLSFETKHLFSEQLKDVLFFKDKNGTTLTKNLAGGEAWAGFAMNLDLRKTEDFLSKYMPETRKELIQNLPEEIRFALLGLGDHPFAKLFTGQLGAVTTGDAKSAMGMEFQFSAFLGLGQQGDMVKGIVDEQLSSIATKSGNTFVLGETTKVETSNSAIRVNSSPLNSPAKTPSYIQKFGEDSFSFFIAFDKIDVASLELDDEYKVVEILKYLSFHLDRDGSQFIIEAKKNDKNILNQISDFYTNSLMEKIGGMGI
jgi:hypothetical protein